MPAKNRLAVKSLKQNQLSIILKSGVSYFWGSNGVVSTVSKASGFDKRKKTITRTFRIRQEWDNVLQEEATRQGVSVNVLVNKILRKYALYSRWNDRNNDTSLPKRTLHKIINTCQVEELAEAGTRSGALDAMNLVNAMGLKLDYDSFVYLVTEHLGGPHFARWFQCFYHPQESTDLFHVQHDFGHAWSVFLESFLLSFLRSMTGMDAKTRIYDYAVTLKVTHPKTKAV
jgi:hypothetical protein